MNTHYIVEIPPDRREELQQAVMAMNHGGHAETPREVIMGDAHRSAGLDEVEYFYDERIREEYPQLRPWDDLDMETQRGVASIMADSRDYQFSDIHRVDWEELYGLITESYPDAVGPARSAGREEPE